VLNAFIATGHTASLVSGPRDFEGIDILVFPGQGAFGDSVRILKKHDLWQPLKDWLAAERPYLGICLGYQLLFEASEEAPGIEGLCIAPGTVRKFKPGTGLKIPHMGWNEVRWHDRAAHVTTGYGIEFASGIVKKNLFAVQFHPEKSQAAGLKLLDNAVRSFG
jgi:imidazole glycerol phosphate synthase glutamine amidotransferase subunit